MPLGRALLSLGSCCIVAAFSLGCAVISPPPLLPQLAGTVPNAPGDMRILLVVGLGTGVLSNSGIGGEVRFERQINEWATMGGGLGGGFNPDGTSESRSKRNLPDWMYAFRTWGRFNPASVDWLAMTTGAGISGTNRGTVALTFDGSALFGGPIALNDALPGEAFRLMPYGGPVAAVSIPLRQGDQIRKQKYWLGLGPDARTLATSEPIEFTTTYYMGMQAGLVADSGPAPAWTGALELAILAAISGTDSAAIFALATGQGARIRR